MAQTDGDILRVVDVNKRFEGVRALDTVGFSVKTGQIKALIGPNGAGKTTLLNVINGLLAPDSGHVYFCAQEVVGVKPDRIALMGLARTFQLIRLFTVNNATVLDNVMIGAHSKAEPTLLSALLFRRRMAKRETLLRQRAMELLHFVGLEWAAGMQPGTLSFGNQRLVELARSLMTEPRLLLLDEPASGLNDLEMERFMQLLIAIRGQGIAILLVEHNMKLVMNISDDIVVLDFGRWLAEGNPAAICANPAVIKAYLGSAGARLREERDEA